MFGKVVVGALGAQSAGEVQHDGKLFFVRQVLPDIFTCLLAIGSRAIGSRAIIGSRVS